MYSNNNFHSPRKPSARPPRGGGSRGSRGNNYYAGASSSSSAGRQPLYHQANHHHMHPPPFGSQHNNMYAADAHLTPEGQFPPPPMYPYPALYPHYGAYASPMPPSHAPPTWWQPPPVYAVGVPSGMNNSVPAEDDGEIEEGEDQSDYHHTTDNNANWRSELPPPIASENFRKNIHNNYEAENDDARRRTTSRNSSQRPPLLTNDMNESSSALRDLMDFTDLVPSVAHRYFNYTTDNGDRSTTENNNSESNNLPSASTREEEQHHQSDRYSTKKAKYPPPPPPLPNLSFGVYSAIKILNNNADESHGDPARQSSSRSSIKMSQCGGAIAALRETEMEISTPSMRSHVAVAAGEERNENAGGATPYAAAPDMQFRRIFQEAGLETDWSRLFASPVAAQLNTPTAAAAVQLVSPQKQAPTSMVALHDEVSDAADKNYAEARALAANQEQPATDDFTEQQQHRVIGQLTVAAEQATFPDTNNQPVDPIAEFVAAPKQPRCEGELTMSDICGRSNMSVNKAAVKPARGASMHALQDFIRKITLDTERKSLPPELTAPLKPVRTRQTVMPQNSNSVNDAAANVVYMLEDLMSTRDVGLNECFKKLVIIRGPKRHYKTAVAKRIAQEFVERNRQAQFAGNNPYDYVSRVVSAEDMNPELYSDNSAKQQHQRDADAVSDNSYCTPAKQHDRSPVPEQDEETRCRAGDRAAFMATSYMKYYNTRRINYLLILEGWFEYEDELQKMMLELLKPFKDVEAFVVDLGAELAYHGVSGKKMSKRCSWHPQSLKKWAFLRPLVFEAYWLKQAVRDWDFADDDRIRTAAAAAAAAAKQAALVNEQRTIADRDLLGESPPPHPEDLFPSTAVMLSKDAVKLHSNDSINGSKHPVGYAPLPKRAPFPPLGDYDADNNNGMLPLPIPPHLSSNSNVNKHAPASRVPGLGPPVFADQRRHDLPPPPPPAPVLPILFPPPPPQLLARPAVHQATATDEGDDGMRHESIFLAEHFDRRQLPPPISPLVPPVFSPGNPIHTSFGNNNGSNNNFNDYADSTPPCSTPSVLPKNSREQKLIDILSGRRSKILGTDIGNETRRTDDDEDDDEFRRRRRRSRSRSPSQPFHSRYGSRRDEIVAQAATGSRIDDELRHHRERSDSLFSNDRDHHSRHGRQRRDDDEADSDRRRTESRESQPRATKMSEMYDNFSPFPVKDGAVVDCQQQEQIRGPPRRLSVNAAAASELNKNSQLKLLSSISGRGPPRDEDIRRLPVNLPKRELFGPKTRGGFDGCPFAAARTAAAHPTSIKNEPDVKREEYANDNGYSFAPVANDDDDAERLPPSPNPVMIDPTDRVKTSPTKESKKQDQHQSTSLAAMVASLVDLKPEKKLAAATVNGLRPKIKRSMGTAADGAATTPVSVADTAADAAAAAASPAKKLKANDDLKPAFKTTLPQTVTTSATIVTPSSVKDISSTPMAAQSLKKKVSFGQDAVVAVTSNGNAEQAEATTSATTPAATPAAPAAAAPTMTASNFKESLYKLLSSVHDDGLLSAQSLERMKKKAEILAESTAVTPEEEASALALEKSVKKLRKKNKRKTVHSSDEDDADILYSVAGKENNKTITEAGSNNAAASNSEKNQSVRANNESADKTTPPKIAANAASNNRKAIIDDDSDDDSFPILSTQVRPASTAAAAAEKPKLPLDSTDAAKKNEAAGGRLVRKRSLSSSSSSSSTSSTSSASSSTSQTLKSLSKNKSSAIVVAAAKQPVKNVPKYQPLPTSIKLTLPLTISKLTANDKDAEVSKPSGLLGTLPGPFSLAAHPSITMPSLPHFDISDFANVESVRSFRHKKLPDETGTMVVQAQRLLVKSRTGGVRKRYWRLQKLVERLKLSVDSAPPAASVPPLIQKDDVPNATAAITNMPTLVDIDDAVNFSDGTEAQSVSPQPQQSSSRSIEP